MLKFPFCFYEDRVEDDPGEITLLGVRFRHQIDPKIDANKTYPKVDFYLEGESSEIDVWDGEDNLVCTIKVELQVRPLDPHTR